MGYKGLILDVDGCITPEESVAWDAALFHRFADVARAAAVGRGPVPPITLCTGRPQPYVEVLMKLLDVRLPAICENGAVLYTLHDNRARYGPGVTQAKIEGLRALRAHLETHVLPGEPKAVLQFGKEAQISVFSETPEVFPAIRHQIDAFIQRHGGPELHITASHYYLNISLAGVDKGRALGQLLREWGITKAEAAGIGDTEGDLPLRDAVGYFACPANATPAIQAAADYVSSYPTLEGVLDILSRF